ncbi:MAG: hypothetical protein A2516_07565 [Alphaproteobacteria bacterium RIFOXYD12_FULL_60_8]|nr:MAG: hypothetical protein A2516_07565 [Alphaproteobacteria bacterium RIFOXYD12_FULL_60_8]
MDVKSAKEYVPAIGVLVVGLVVTVLLAFYVNGAERERAMAHFVRSTNDHIETFFTDVARQLDDLHHLTIIYESASTPPEQLVLAFADYILEDFPSVKAVGVLPSQRTDTTSPFVLPAPKDPSWVAELARDDVVWEAAEKARALGETVLTHRLNNGSTPGGEGPYVLAISPIHKGDGKVNGFVFGLLAIPVMTQSFLVGSTHTSLGDQPFFYALEESDGTVLDAHGTAPLRHSDVFSQSKMVGEREWVLRLWPQGEIRDSSSLSRPWWMLAAGVLVSFLSAGYFFSVHRRNLIIRRNQAILDGISRTAQDAVVMLDQEGDVSFWNTAAENMFGYGQAEILGKSLHEILVPERFRKGFHDNFPRFQATGKGNVVNTVVVLSALHRDGREFPVELSIGAIPVGGHWEAIGMVRDISSRVEGEKAVRMSERASALGNLAGGVAHELNNLLLPILALSEMTATRMPEGSSERRRLNKITEAATRAKDLVDRIMTFSHLGTANLEKVDSLVAVHEALILARRVLPSTLRIDEDLEPSTGTILADCHRLESIFLQLGGNAIDALKGQNGVLTVSLKPVVFKSMQELPDPSLQPGAYAELLVADNGPGMPPEVLEHVFDPFFTTKPVGEGTGLGLSMVHAIVVAHGGAIKAASTLGQGAVFSLYLPLQQ